MKKTFHFATNQKDSDTVHELKDALNEFEKKYILKTLQKHQGKISETARVLGIDRSNLFKKMRKLGLNH